VSSQHVERGARLSRDAAAERDAELGTCDVCGQVLLRTADDCWHPWNVLRACPPEPSTVPWDIKGWLDFRAAGLSSHRPGREHFVPDPTDDDDEER